MSWMNGDNLYVKFGREEGISAQGGEFGALDLGRHVIDFVISYLDAGSATAAVLGSDADTPNGTGSRGVIVPANAYIEELELRAETAFTSSGTIGSSTLVIGLNKASDRSTALDVDGFTTTSFVLGVLDAAGEDVMVNIGTTGAGALIGTQLSEAGVIVVANSAHASHPLTAGSARCRLFYKFLD